MIKFSLLANALPTFTTGTPLSKKVDDLQDYQVQLLDFLRYALQNLEADNFNETGLSEILEPVLVEVKGVNGRVSSLKITADGISSTVEALGNDLGDFESWAEGEISGVKSSVKQTADSLSAIVSSVGSGGSVTAASIIAAINNDYSEVMIKADKVDISGFVTFSDLSNSGETEINGDNITTGTIRGVNFIALGSAELGMEYNSFRVIDLDKDAMIGGIGYQYFEDDVTSGYTDHGDKLWIRTVEFRNYPTIYHPSIKIESAGGVSIESVDGHGVFIYDGSGTEWMFKGGSLYKDGTVVL